MAEVSTTNPQITDGNTPLRVLALQALRRFGEFAPGTVDGDVMLMFLEFANLVIDDVRMHPYHTPTTEINYYQSIDESRAVDDTVIIAGLLAHYAAQQGSDRLSLLMPQYLQTLNRQLWRSFNGNTAIQLRVVDDGTHPRNKNGGKTSVKNGSVTF